MIQAAILGYGNIGSGVATVLSMNSDVIAKKVGDTVALKYILEIRDVDDSDPFKQCIVKDLSVILNDPEIQIVVETMGGTKPAYEFVKNALLAGKNVATSNKELVAKHGAELLAIAKEKNISFLFEASVGGGIPIIRPLNSSITSDEVDEITGILNGTTNFMLTKMSKDGYSFEQALKEAQDLGYAERNPEADVEGHDACRKIAILCSLAFGKLVMSEKIATEGITKITDVDMKYADAMNMTIKLLATGFKQDGKVFATVSPKMIPMTHPLAGINEVMNGILVNGDVIGDLMFYGAGAGKLPTASAVVADVVEEARHPHMTQMEGWSAEELELADTKEASYCFFFRVKSEAADGVAAAFAGTKCEQVCAGLVDGEAAFVTEMMKEAAFDKAYETLGSAVLGRIRMA